MKHESAGRLIRELARAAHIYFQHEFKKYNIGHAQIRTLLYISKNEGKTQKEITQYLCLDKSSITSQLQILERNGYVKRETSEADARKQVIYITQKTKDILPHLYNAHQEWTDALLDGFSESEQTEVYNYLYRMGNNLKKKIEPILPHNTMNCIYEEKK